MTKKTEIVLVILTLVSTFAIGRYSAPVKIETKTIEVEKKTENKDLESDKHKDTKTTTTTSKDGTTTTTTETVEDTHKHLDDIKTDDTAKSTETKTEYSSSKMTISALAGISATIPPTPVYGMTAQKPLIGPIVLGGWAMSSREIGISLGLQF